MFLPTRTRLALCRQLKTAVPPIVFVGGFLALDSSVYAAIQHDAAHQTVTLSDEQGNLKLRLNYANQCVLDQMVVRGRQVMAPSGAASGIQFGGQWYTTRNRIAAPKIVVGKDSLTVMGIVFGRPGENVSEEWNFKVKNDRIVWGIKRRYPKELQLEDAAFPAWNFASMTTWTGGILDTGGVVWNKYLEGKNMTYGAHAGAVTFWNREKNDCLRIVPTVGPEFHSAVRFSHQPKPSGDELVFNTSISREELKTKHGFNRFLGDRQDLWAPFKASPGAQSVEFSLQALDYAKTYDRGTFKGVDGSSIRELMNTAGRYGVIDDKLVGGNGWRSGYICLHEQWFAQIGMVLNDPNYNANYAATLDYFRDNAVKPDGRVLSRWCYGAFDAMPGTYTDKGFYEAQWGYLLDSQTDYVIDVAEQFDLSGDRKWLAGQKEVCERALDYLMRREVGQSGLVAVMTDSRLQQKGSDWFDIVWASYQNALINAELYHALMLWSEAEENLSDTRQANRYRTFAARLKESFNCSVSEGGFWEPTKQRYVYWRDKDGSIHGDNFFTAVNFAAISYGLCDDKGRQKAILEGIETLMQKEALFHWPTNFTPFERDEVGGGNYPFPKYENGDIFMSWGEVALRAYANYDPAIALKYVKKALARYEADGLSFQRYTRREQKGAGDDILAGNCMAIVGLYRNIYGLQPKPNRLYLEPHLTSELNETQLRYLLRGRPYTIDLHTAGSSIRAQNVTVLHRQPFGINATPTGIEFFPAQSKNWALSVTPSKNQSLRIQVQRWNSDVEAPRTWIESGVAGKGAVEHRVAGLRPNATYLLRSGGKLKLLLRSSKTGQVKFITNVTGNTPQAFELSLKVS